MSMLRFKHVVSLTTAAVAFTAAYFSVYGLAFTFGGVFWSVVIMGGALEISKLVATSYLYRYWDDTHLLLKSYMMLGVAALMILTSTGIFGYLSAGYQQDALPLKQQAEQLKTLDAERTDLLKRRQDLDASIATAVVKIDQVNANAARVLKESAKAQQSNHMRSKAEYDRIVGRLGQIDEATAEIKQSMIKAEAHIGPIVYIAEVFGSTPDNATKYLILLIIFAFDPMAIALTLAYNKLVMEPEDVVGEIVVTEPPPNVTPDIADQENLIDSPVYIVDTSDPYVEAAVEPITEPLAAELELVTTEAEVPPLEITPDFAPPEPPPLMQKPEPAVTTPRVLPRGWTIDPQRPEIRELIDHHRHLREKQASGHVLNTEETMEKFIIERALKDKGFAMYLQ